MEIPGSDMGAQILYAGIRFTLAGILTVLLGSVGSRKILLPSKTNFFKILKLCMLQTVSQYLFFYIGLAHTSGVKASIIEGMNVFVAILIASLVFHQEKLTWKKVVGCVLGFLGVILVNLSGNRIESSLSFFGEGFIFLSTVSYAFSSVLIKKYSRTENPVLMSGWQFILGGLIMLLCGVLLGGRLTTWNQKSILMLLYLAFVSAVAYTLWSLLLKYNPISKVAVFGFMNPVFGVILSSILLKEGSLLRVTSIISLALVCLGIYIVNRKDH